MVFSNTKLNFISKFHASKREFIDAVVDTNPGKCKSLIPITTKKKTKNKKQKNLRKDIPTKK